MSALRAATIMLLLIAAAFARPAAAQAEDERAERLVKAAYLFHFCGLVTWPPGAWTGSDAVVRVGVLGDDPLADELSRVAAGRQVQGRTLQVTKLNRNSSRNNLHLLYLDQQSGVPLASILQPLRQQPVLTVTDAEQGLASGAIIRFLTVDQRLRFEVSTQAATAAGLGISTRLLAVSWKFAPVSPKFSQD